MSASEVGVLTVGRFLCEGVGDDVRCFINTKNGLQEVQYFTSRNEVILALNSNKEPLRVQSDTEVFLARRNLSNLTREEMLPIAEHAAHHLAIPAPMKHVETPQVMYRNKMMPRVLRLINRIFSRKA